MKNKSQSQGQSFNPITSRHGDSLECTREKLLSRYRNGAGGSLLRGEVIVERAEADICALCYVLNHQPPRSSLCNSRIHSLHKTAARFLPAPRGARLPDKPRTSFRSPNVLLCQAEPPDKSHE